MYTHEIGNLFFALQLMLGEGLFLYGAPRRKWFILRLLISITLMSLSSCFYPHPTEFAYEIWFLIIRFVSLFMLSVLLAWCCFDISFSAALSLCGAGYATQHIAYQTANIFYQTNWIQNPDWGHLIMESIVLPFIYVGIFFLFARPAKHDHHYSHLDFRFDLIALFILLICVGLSRLTRMSSDSSVIISSGLYAITCCMSALVIQFYLRKALALAQEKKAIENLWDKDKKHYEISKKTMEILNIKAHDLKHKLFSLNSHLPQEEIDSMKKVIDEYDSHLKTGNDALDVLLNEKNTVCLAKKISFTILGDGKLLSFMKKMDIYSLLGNALDNAIEAVTPIQEKEKKVISMNIESKGEMIFITVRNYTINNLSLIDGLPQTTKDFEDGFHGFGLKSIRFIANKYNGDIQFHQKDDVFTLTIFLKQISQ